MTLPIPRDCSRSARFSALEAFSSRCALRVCAVAATGFMLVVEGTDRDGEIGEAGGGGSGGGVVETVDAWQTLGFDGGGTLGVVRVANAVNSG